MHELDILQSFTWQWKDRYPLRETPRTKAQDPVVFQIFAIMEPSTKSH